MVHVKYSSNKTCFQKIDLIKKYVFNLYNPTFYAFYVYTKYYYNDNMIN